MIGPKDSDCEYVLRVEFGGGYDGCYIHFKRRKQAIEHFQQRLLNPFWDGFEYPHISMLLKYFVDDFKSVIVASYSAGVIYYRSQTSANEGTIRPFKQSPLMKLKR